jgi:hypothetical protein
MAVAVVAVAVADTAGTEAVVLRIRGRHTVPGAEAEGVVPSSHLEEAAVDRTLVGEGRHILGRMEAVEVTGHCSLQTCQAGDTHRRLEEDLDYSRSFAGEAEYQVIQLAMPR